jgi:uncharacterized membrane protein
MVAVVLAVLAGLCWGVGEMCTKSLLSSGKIGPLAALAVRASIALPAIWLAAVVALRTGGEAQPSWRELGAANLAKLVLGSRLCAGALAMIAFYAALARDDVSRIKPIAFTVAPAAAALLGWLVLGEPMSGRKALALALILSGVVLLASAPARVTGR